MKYLSLIVVGLSLCAAACSTDKTANENDTAVAANDSVSEVVLAGEWQLVGYNANDSMVNVDSTFVLTFNPSDSTFSMTTDCNTIQGKYIQNGDSLKFDNMMSTRMMAPVMDVENAFNAIFPNVQTVVLTDSTLNLQSAGNTVATFKK